MRKLTIILSLILTFFAVEVSALGLSHIQVSSKLNEPFNAKITIYSIPKTSTSNIQVRLASRTAFKRAGLERLYILTKLRFQIQIVSQKKAVVHITTEQAIKEPFLNFLLEVRWMGGRMLREYTVLLDPPVYKNTATTSYQPPIKSPRETVSYSSRTKQPVISGDPYTISRRDSLWKIAKKTRPSGVSIQKQMNRIYNANRHAFIRGNKTRIKAGKVITIPGWTNQGRTRRTRRTTRPSQDNVRIPSRNVGPRLVLRPPEATPAPLPVRPVPTNQGGESNRAEMEALHQQIRTLKANNTKITSKNDDLNKDVRKNRDLAVTMKKQLDELNKMLTLQNRRMAELQRQLTDQTRSNQQLKTKVAELNENGAKAQTPPVVPVKNLPQQPENQEPVKVTSQPENNNAQPTTPVPEIPFISFFDIASSLDIQVQKQVSKQRQAKPSLNAKLAEFPILLIETPNTQVATLHLSPEQLADLHNKLYGKILSQLGKKPSLINRITEESYGSPEKIAKLMTESVILQFKKGTPEEIAKLVKNLKINLSQKKSLKDTANLVTDLKQGSLNEFLNMTAKSQVALLEAKSQEEITKLVDASEEESGLVRQAKVLLQQAIDNWVIVILALVGGILILFLIRLRRNKLSSILPGNFTLPKSLKKELKGLKGMRYQGKSNDNELYKQVFLDEVRRINNLADTMPDEPSEGIIPDVAYIPEGDEELHEEVELYKAYERYDKAEELLRNAIALHPDYPKYSFNLLELHAVTNDTQKFKDDAALLYKVVNGEGPLWKNTLELWEFLAPNQALLSPDVENQVKTEEPVIAGSSSHLTSPTTVDDFPEEKDFPEFSGEVTTTGTNQTNNELQGLDLPQININQEPNVQSGTNSSSNQSSDAGDEFNFDEDFKFDEFNEDFGLDNGADDTGNVENVETEIKPKDNLEIATDELSLDDDLLFEDSGKDETVEQLDKAEPLEEQNEKSEELSSDTDELSLDGLDDLGDLGDNNFSLDDDNDKTEGLSLEDEFSSLDTGDTSELSLGGEFSSDTDTGELSLDDLDDLGDSDFSLDDDNDKTEGLSLEDELSSLDTGDTSELSLGGEFSSDTDTGELSLDDLGDSDFSLDDDNDKTDGLSLEDELSSLDTGDTSELSLGGELSLDTDIGELSLDDNDFSLNDSNEKTDGLSLEDEFSSLDTGDTSELLLGGDLSSDTDTGELSLDDLGDSDFSLDDDNDKTDGLSLEDELSSLDTGDLSLDTGDTSELSLESELLDTDIGELSLDDNDFSLDDSNEKTDGLSLEDELSSLDTGDLSFDTSDNEKTDGLSFEDELSSLDSTDDKLSSLENADNKTSKLSLEEELLADEDGGSYETVFLVEKESLSQNNQDTLNDNSLTDDLSFEDELSSLESEKTSGLSLDEELSPDEDETIFLVEKETMTEDKREETALKENDKEDLFSLKDDNDSTADLSSENELSWLNEDSLFDKSEDTDLTDSLSSVDDLLNDDLSPSNHTESSKDLLEDDEFDFSALNSDKKSEDAEIPNLSDNDDDLEKLLSQLDTEVEISESDGSNPLNGQFDLAQMYIDMDDNETARQILEELLTSPNGEEVRLAQKMIAELG